MIKGATQLLKWLDEIGGLLQKLILKYFAAG